MGVIGSCAMLSEYLGGGPLTRTSFVRMRLLLAFGPALVAACQGHLGEGDEPGARGGTPGSGRTGGDQGTGPSSTGGAGLSPGTPGTGGSPTTSLDCSQPRATATHLRVLTDSQYNNTVLDLLQVSGNLATGLGPNLDDVSLEQRATVASTVATQALANLAKWAPCTPPATGSAAACEQQFIDKLAPKLFRRPLTDGQRTDLKALFDAGIKSKDFNTGVEWFLTGILQSPQFVYEVIRPATSEKVGDIRPLDGYEYADRLAYFIWDGPADDALMTAAANNDLADVTKRNAQIARMLQDARFSRSVSQFYRLWLNLNAFGELARNATGFDQSVVDGLSTSLLMSATQLYSSPSPNIRDLFSGNTYYLNDVLRKFYGVAGTGTAFAAVAMPNQARRGILTHPALMALMARPQQTFPIGRGLFVLRNLVCKYVPPPPQNVDIPPFPLPQDGVSTRQALQTLTSPDFCQACHSMINGAGFAFEAFDEVGRYRTTDHGIAVDTSGSLAIGKDIDGPFASGDELLARLADSKDVRACFAENYLDFALSHPVTDPADTCSIQSLASSFGASGDLKQLVASVATSDSFRLRLAEGVGP